MLYTYTGSQEYSTYVVIAILRQERNSLPRHGAPAGGTGELLLRLQHVGDQVRVCKGAGGGAVDDGGGVVAVVAEGVEEGEIGQC
jgi:hypothetical protein